MKADDDEIHHPFDTRQPSENPLIEMEFHEQQQRQAEATVIDLTDSPPLHPARLPLSTNLPKPSMEERLLAIKQRDKHVPPAKVKLLAPNQLPQSNNAPAPRFPVPQPYVAPRTNAYTPAFSTLPPPGPQQSTVPYGTVYSTPLYGDPLAHEPEPLEGSYGPQISATERDRQLQDMLDNIADLDDDEEGGAQGSDGSLQGLKCTLMPHQVQGVRWMRERESGRDKGGLLADDMGLGKTVQTLGLIVSNQPGVEGTTIDCIREAKKAAKPAAGKEASTVPKAPEAPPKPITVKGKSTLIIAPLAVVQQWASEVQDKTDSLKVYIHHGPKRTTSGARLKQYDVVVTTYSTASSEWTNSMGADFFDSDDEHSDDKAKGTAKSKAKAKSKAAGSSSSSESDSDEGTFRPPKNKKKGGGPKASPCPLFETGWLRVVLDEAHTIKNRKTKAAKACYALSSKATSRWCLTGTPIQNDAYEMWSMIHFLGIKPFEDYAHFKEKIGDPLKSTNQNRVNWGMKRLCIVLQSIMLRRTKDAKNTDGSAILQLPARIVDVVEVDFDNAEEREFYTMLERKMKHNLEVIQEAGPIDHLGILTMLLRMRQACSHPSLIFRKVSADADAVAPTPQAADPSKAPSTAQADDDSDDDGGLADMLSALTVQHLCTHCQISVPASVAQIQSQSGGGAKEGVILCTSCAEAERARELKGVRWREPGKGSTKIRLLMKLLKETQERGEGEKTIVFSQFTSWLDLVEPFLKQEKLKYVRYDGSMTAPKREVALATIRSDPQCTVLLLSFKAGSVGLNLTCCNRVVLCDLWWNPAIEEQAFDRAHRLGQKRDVHVSKLSILNTIEARILELQIKKRALSKAALEGGKLKKGRKGLDLREILFLFNSGPAA